MARREMLGNNPKMRAIGGTGIILFYTFISLCLLGALIAGIFLFG